MTFPALRRPYDDPDTAQDMARDASACRRAENLSLSDAPLTLARHAHRQGPAALRLQAGQQARAVLDVSDRAVRLATRLLD